MQYRRFGRTGWSVSEISFGAWQLGGQWGQVDDDQSMAALLAAYESGVNLVDTAEMYGNGHSEVVVGRSLREWGGDTVRIATKIQPTAWPDAADDDPQIRDRYADHYLRDQVDASLKRLNVERIDLLQLHCWMPSGTTELGWYETLSDLQRAGKIDKIGVSLRDYRPDEGVELAELGLVDSIQVIFNLFEQRPLEELFPAAAASETAIIARVALDSGSLSGAWTRTTYSTWEEGSVLSTLFRGSRFTETLEHVERLKELTAPYYETLAEAAIRYVLDPPAVSTTIIGMSNARRLPRNLAYSDGVGFTAELREAIAAHEWRRNYYA